MLGDPGGHRRTPLLPSAFFRPLSQCPMRMMKIVAPRPNPTEDLMPIGPPRKAQDFAPFSCVAHSIGQVEPLNGTGVGFRPAQVGYDLGQFALTKDQADFYLLNPPSLPMFDNLGTSWAVIERCFFATYDHFSSNWRAAGCTSRTSRPCN